MRRCILIVCCSWSSHHSPQLPAKANSSLQGTNVQTLWSKSKGLSIAKESSRCHAGDYRARIQVLILSRYLQTHVHTCLTKAASLRLVLVGIQDTQEYSAQLTEGLRKFIVWHSSMHNRDSWNVTRHHRHVWVQCLVHLESTPRGSFPLSAVFSSSAPLTCRPCQPGSNSRMWGLKYPYLLQNTCSVRTIMTCPVCPYCDS